MVKKNNHVAFRRKFIPDIAIRDAKLSGKTNFRGEERMRKGRIVNNAGNRNFCVDIPREGVMLADGTDDWITPEELIEQGWPLKIHAGSEDDEPSYYMSVKVNFSFRAPTVWSVVGSKRVRVGEDTIDLFDGRNFSRVNLIIHPSIRQDWDTGETAVSVYLAEGFFYVATSPFEQEWQDEHPDEDDWA